MKNRDIVLSSIVMIAFCLCQCFGPPKKIPPVEEQAPGVEAAKKDRIVPDSEFCKSIAIPDKTTRAVGVRGKYWTNGQTLRVKLIGGTATQRAYLTNSILEWQRHININVSYVTTGNADIRVAFVSGGGSWSYCGNEALSIPQSQPTMNIGWSGNDVCLHELGHAFGAAHEQSSPTSDINWNKPVVYAALGGPPNNWSQATVDWNVFRKLTPTEAEATVFDPTSIMQYSVPGSWTYNYPSGIAGGKVLSPTDIAFWSAKYPKAIPPPGNNVTITKAQADSLKTNAKYLSDQVARILK